MGSAHITGASEEAALTGLGANSDTQGKNPAGDDGFRLEERGHTGSYFFDFDQKQTDA